MRTRLLDALKERGYETLEAEKVALYTTEGVRCIPKFMKVMTRAEPAETEEVIEALGRVLDETPALEKAKRIQLRLYLTAPPGFTFGLPVACVLLAKSFARSSAPPPNNSFDRSAD